MTQTTNGSALAVSTGETRLGKIRTRWELVTPARAQAYLACTQQNRNYMPTAGERYARDMASGCWAVTHQGIAFADDGSLIDGQHRLHAIVESGAEQWLLVTEGLSLLAIETMDRGRVRTFAHTLKILGYDLHTHRAVATARSMYVGTGANGPGCDLSDVALKAFFDRHQDAIFFGCTQPNAIGPAPVVACLARAYYHVAPADLRRFTAAMLDQIPAGEQKPGDRSARLLFRAVEAAKGKTGGSYRASLYRKSQNALCHYLDGTDLKAVHESTENLFPLSEEVAHGG